jgi:hypothetical protein
MENLEYLKLPTIEELKRILLSEASLDIIMNDCKDNTFPLVRFYRNYSNEVDMVYITNNSIDDIYILFSVNGSIIKGFDHESMLSPYANDNNEIAKGIYDSVPHELLKLLDEGVDRDDVTFCLWRRQVDLFWRKGDVIDPEKYNSLDDGEDFLLKYIFNSADTWLDWAKFYYGKKADSIPIDCVKKIYEHKNITRDTIKIINPNREVEIAIKELKEIGYMWIL